MRYGTWIALLALVLGACGGEEATDPAPAPDVFRFDSGGAWDLQGLGAWRVTATRDGRFRATHVVRDEETAYEEVALPPAERAILWAVIDQAGLDTLVIPERPGVPDEVQLTFRLERRTGATRDVREVVVWQNDARRRLTLQPLLQELRIRIEAACGVMPVF